MKKLTLIQPPRLPIRLAAVAMLGITATPAGPAPGTHSAQDADQEIRAHFAGDWTARWETAELAKRVNTFTVSGDETARVLKVESERSASALYHSIDRPTTSAGTVSWRWKVERALPGGEPERTRRGDDYAARFFVIFDGQPFSRKARAICYVWAAAEPSGSAYRNPYFPEVATVVLESGDEKRGEWVLEERDFLKDFTAAFGSAPQTVTAVAVMVDTDNTRTRATAWFTDITIRPPSQSESPAPALRQRR